MELGTCVKCQSSILNPSYIRCSRPSGIVHRLENNRWEARTGLPSSLTVSDTSTIQLGPFQASRKWSSAYLLVACSDVPGMDHLVVHRYVKARTLTLEEAGKITLQYFAIGSARQEEVGPFSGRCLETVSGCAGHPHG